MNTNIANYITGLNRRNFTNNTQRALHVLLMASLNGTGWVSRGSVRVASAPARIRDLRKADYGQFEIQCASSFQLGRTGGTRTTFYKINTQGISLAQLRTVFGTI
jgi:hypothetical protein